MECSIICNQKHSNGCKSALKTFTDRDNPGNLLQMTISPLSQQFHSLNQNSFWILSGLNILNYWLYSLPSFSKFVICRQKCFGDRAGDVLLDLIHSKLDLNSLIRHGLSSRSLWATMMNSTQLILEDRDRARGTQMPVPLHLALWGKKGEERV